MAETIVHHPLDRDVPVTRWCSYLDAKDENQGTQFLSQRTSRFHFVCSQAELQRELLECVIEYLRCAQVVLSFASGAALWRF